MKPLILGIAEVQWMRFRQDIYNVIYILLTHTDTIYCYNLVKQIAFLSILAIMYLYINKSAKPKLLLPPFLVEQESNVSASCVEVMLDNTRISLHITSDITDGKTHGISSSVGDTVAQSDGESHNSSTPLFIYLFIHKPNTLTLVN